MNIVLIGGQNVPGIGGAEAYMFNLAKSLHKLNHKITIICSNRSSYEKCVEGIDIVHKKCPKSNVLALPILFFISLGYIFQNRKEIDVVNYHAIYLAFIPGWIASLLGCKVFYTIHSFAEDNPKHGGLLKFAMKLFSFISIWGCGKNLHTISHSKADVIRKRFGKESTVIPCGINIVSKLEDTDILQRFGLEKATYYLTIGRIDPIKNLDVLIKAFLKREKKDYHLVIAGDYNNTYGDYLRSLAQDDKHIHFVGIVMGDDKETLLKNCFVNCLVSSNEGMPISLLEAMVYAKPCIVTDIPAIREVVDDKWGYWCSVGNQNEIVNQMVMIENDYDEALHRAGEMAEYVKKYHLWDSVAELYVNYLLSI